MTQELWTAVDRYLVDLLVPPDLALDAAMEASEEAGLPPISVSPTQGKFLHLLAKIKGARTILEIGTLGGYSTIWFARALPAGGRIVTLEADPKHAKVARWNLSRGAGRRDRHAARPCLGDPAGAGRRAIRAIRSDLHRRRQAEHARLFRVGPEALTAGT